ncbi:MAG: hypothetical protein LIO75_01845 [Lachnospiraceae bacterium]|nr:hypothetical protein [Lachnospiraceae bacterium]
MMDFKLTQQVQRRKKKNSRLLSTLMVVLAIILVLCGIAFDNSFFLPAFCLAFLYYVFTFFSDSAYEYNFENEAFSIDVIRGKRRRTTAHYLYYKNLEVVAPPDHELVLKYKKKGGTEHIKKYDYTSYEDGIPYYTMIITQNDEKIKLLLDLDEQTLRFLKLRYPQKVFLQ